MKKSSGKEEPGRSLEDVFRDGFLDAESTPSSKLWDNLDRELENQELKRYKRYAFWYRSVAAACVVLLLAVGGFFYKNKTEQIVWPRSGVVAISEEKNKAKEEITAKDDEILTEEGPASATIKGDLPISDLIYEKEDRNSKRIKRNSASQKLAKEKVKQPNPFNQNKGTGESAADGIAASRQTAARVAGVLGQNVRDRQTAGELVMEQKSETENALGAVALKKSITSLLDSVAAREVPTILLQKPKEALAVVKENEKESAAEASKWSLALAYAPQYAYAPIKANGGGGAGNYYASPELSGQPSQYYAYQAALDEYTQTYEPAYSYRASVGANYNLNQKWYLESGLLYAENRGNTQNSYILNNSSGNLSFSNNRQTPFPISNNPGLDQSSGNNELVTRTAPYTTHYSYQQIGVPVKVGYRHFFDRVFAYAASGFHVNLLVKNSIKPETNQLSAQHYTFNDTNSPFNTWQLSSVASAGIGYVISEKVTVSMAPEITYALTPFFKNNQYQKNNLQMGISIESKWRIIK